MTIRTVAIMVGLLGAALIPISDVVPTSELPTPPGFKVAFIADQGLSANAIAVLLLIRNEGTDMVLHQGDLAYSADAQAWDQNIDAVLGADFPYFASIGNHDCLDPPGCTGPGVWADYQALLARRLQRVDGATCTGDLGVRAACTYGGLFFILSGAGTRGEDPAEFISEALAADNSTWRICSWHKNQGPMQVGEKSNEVGWGPYEACRLGGAIVATGHDHAYARTHLMSSFENQVVASTSDTLEIDAGQSFAFVSGLGGASVRPQNPDRAGNPWWATVFRKDQGANFGALFCSFNHRGVFNRARCYFKAIDGTIADSFDVIALGATPPPPTPSIAPWRLGLLPLVASVLTVLVIRRRMAGRRGAL